MRILRHLSVRFAATSPIDPPPEPRVAEALRAATLEAFDRYCPAPSANHPWPTASGLRRRDAAAVAARIRLEHILSSAE